MRAVPMRSDLLGGNGADEGRVDVVMNNAAMMMHGLTEAFRPEQVLQILDLNAVSWLRVNRAALPVMRRAGKGLLSTQAVA
jgi:NAD(P)-dependent dehydrogenase (short-subunit alcohol dehydrogenase family)